MFVKVSIEHFVYNNSNFVKVKVVLDFIFIIQDHYVLVKEVHEDHEVDVYKDYSVIYYNNKVVPHVVVYYKIFGGIVFYKVNFVLAYPRIIVDYLIVSINKEVDSVV